MAGLANYKGKHSHELPSDTNLPDEINYFYAHFEASNTETCMRAAADPDDCMIMLSIADLNKTLNPSSTGVPLAEPLDNIQLKRQRAKFKTSQRQESQKAEI